MLKAMSLLHQGAFTAYLSSTETKVLEEVPGESENGLKVGKVGRLGFARQL